MRRVEVAVRVLGYLAKQRGVRVAALRGGVGLLVAAMVWRACGSRPAAPSQVDTRPEPQVPAFCKRFDPSELYLWGETVEAGTGAHRRAIATAAAPDVYCELPARETSLPSVRPDRRLMFVRNFGKSGERAYRYESAGGDGELVPTPNCVTRFSWLTDAERHLHYGCEVRDPYEKQWIPVFYRDAGALIGSGKGLERVLGEPSDGSIVADTRDGLAVVDMGTNEVKPITGLPRTPLLVRATRKGFLAMTDSSSGDDARLFRIDRNGAVTPDGVLAALPAGAVHTPLAMTTDGEVFEYLPDAKDNTVVGRTRRGLRTVYSDAEWKKRGRPFVRLDTKSRWGVALLTSR